MSGSTPDGATAGETAARASGIAAVVLLALAVVGALVLDPTGRSLPLRARLSDLGRVGGRGALLFDGGLLLAGALGCLFARGLWRAAPGAVDPPLARVVAAFAGAGSAALAGAGLFPLPALAHTPLLATVYVAGIAAVVVDAVRVRGVAPDRAATLFGAVGVAVSVWALRAVVGTTFLVKGATGMLLPAELATLGVIAGWTLGRARSLGR